MAKEQMLGGQARAVPRILGDYHTHTNNSDGHDTVETMVRAAAERGLSEIAITDHGPGKLIGRISPKKYSMVKALAEKTGIENNIKVYFGIEANVTGTNGQIDVKCEDLCSTAGKGAGNSAKDKTDKDKPDTTSQNSEQTGGGCIDILLCGIHRTVMPANISSFFTFFLPNWFWSLIGWTPRGRVIKNTEVIKRVISNNNIAIWTHPNRYFRLDVVEAAKVCAERGTLIELNGKRISFRPIDFERMLSVGAKFIIGSDAHRAGRVAEVGRVWDFLSLCDYKDEDIVNLNGLFHRGTPMQIPSISDKPETYKPEPKPEANQMPKQTENQPETNPKNKKELKKQNREIKKNLKKEKKQQKEQIKNKK